MPRLEFKGKSLVANLHFGVPYHELLAEAKKGLSREPKLDDNLIVQGDNLLALKALLPTYAGKVKCIYIDPPYNTGNEGWAYNDNVNSPMMKDWLGKTVDKDDLTRHDKWLCMMMPRLKLLRELLSDDGAIFVSIDDNEQHHLRMLMDEVFGEENFLYEFIWRKVDSPNDNKVPVAISHEYVVAFARQKDNCRLAPLVDPSILNAYGSKDETGRLYRDRLLKKNGKNSLRSDRPSMYYAMIAPDGKKVFPIHDDGREACWSFAEETLKQLAIDGRLIWKKRAGAWVPYIREYAAEENPIKPHPTIWNDLPTMRQAKATLKEVFETEAEMFETPKPHELLVRIFRMASGPNDIILDSFAGSGTTAHAVLALNKEDGGKRRFILVEMEDYADKITAERVRRVIKGVPSAKDENLRNGLGGTFSYFKLGEAVEPSRMLEGKGLPRYEQLASYVFHTATGQPFDESKINRKRHLIGSTNDYDIHLIYEPDMKKLKGLSLDLDTLKELGPAKGRTRLVFAPAKYLDRDQMAENKVEFAQLPFELFRRV